MSNTYTTYITPQPSAPPIIQENVYTSYPQTYHTTIPYTAQSVIYTQPQYDFGHYKKDSHHSHHGHHEHHGHNGHHDDCCCTIL